ncbi:dTDP-4-amino-4,6-dideoxygalactose transaminase [Lachnotalea glycerini]|uniref:dTDP-4-amino-4,6-dideoxygalactose transaminase n=1 Tax=Lachnotalea glycerini TaxID=1763509 RepID=A0A318ETB6_9FIRM|nr:DegT/DnrJ/EryC1/StrS family aminotransferase [Lachnotalea glycerini]OYO76105.1 aminotransferase [Lachnotalea glycerini]PXV87244.1 dTDP-4-amino-4,6-dideoxygalactose transaminase [Lachnotalea glycerini]
MEKIQVTKSSMPSYEEYIEEIKPIWDSHWLTNMGVFHQRLQEQLKEYLQVERLSLFVNGHMALELAIQAMNLSGEVITTPFTFASTTHAIVRNNLTPVFCDIRPDTYTIDEEKIEALITDRTAAIIPVHVYGNVCEIEKIEAIAKKYCLKVIYDAAHAFGIKYKGKGIGTYGDASMFSFHATKVFNTIEGGAICYGDKEFEKLLSQLKNFGIRDEEIVDGVGSNAKMNEFQAAMGICNLRHVEEDIKIRKAIVGQYRKKLADVKGIKLPCIQGDVDSNYAYFSIVIDEKEFGTTRNYVYDKLKEHSVYTRKYFYPLTNTFDCFRGKYNVEDTPIALYISKRVLALPLYTDLSMDKVEFICDKIKDIQR